MFNKYWRSYPWSFQLIQFIILFSVLTSFFVFAVTPFLLHFLNVSPGELTTLAADSSRQVVQAAMLMQMVITMGMFLFPPLLFAYFTHPRPFPYLGLTKPRKNIHLFWVLPMMLGAIPVFLKIAEGVSLINFGEAAQKAQEANDAVFQAMLRIETIPQLLLALIVMAILPGISEELLFRGFMIRFIAKRTAPRVMIPIILSALLFSSLHTNIYGLPSIFLAGVLLGMIYFLTGSLWCSIIAHIFYNGAQVFMAYLYFINTGGSEMAEMDTVPWVWVATGMGLFCISFYAIWKTRTPLPAGWTNDFAGEDRSE